MISTVNSHSHFLEYGERKKLIIQLLKKLIFLNWNNNHDFDKKKTSMKDLNI